MLIIWQFVKHQYFPKKKKKHNFVNLQRDQKLGKILWHPLHPLKKSLVKLILNLIKAAGQLKNNLFL